MTDVITIEPDGGRLPRVTHWTEALPFLGLDLEAGVLDDGRCVLSQKTAMSLLGISRGRKGDRLADFGSQNALKPFVSKHFANGTFSTVTFVHGGTGRPSPGCLADDFIALCQTIRDAYLAKALRKNQVKVGRQVCNVLDAMDRVAFSQMIKNHTGYVDAPGAVAEQFHDRLEQAVEREARALPAPEAAPALTVDPVIEARRIDAEMAKVGLERAKIRQRAIDRALRILNRYPNDHVRHRLAVEGLRGLDEPIDVAHIIEALPAPAALPAPETAQVAPAPPPTVIERVYVPVPVSRGPKQKDVPEQQRFDFRQSRATTGAARSLREHDVRGYVRRQMCGPGRKEPRDVFVSPFRRGGRKAKVASPELAPAAPSSPASIGQETG